MCCAIAVPQLARAREDAKGNEHFQIRRFVIEQTIERFPNSAIVIGDSIVELSTLPREICGHEIINAGVGGAKTSSDLASLVEKPLLKAPSPLIILSIGTNDALLSRDPDTFEGNYRTLLAQLMPLALRVVVLGIPDVEGPPDSNDRIAKFNQKLGVIATSLGVKFAALPPMPPNHTVDDVHLNAKGYAVWDTVVLDQAKELCGK
jgi:lysophospholipase L1-like esterase